MICQAFLDFLGEGKSQIQFLPSLLHNAMHYCHVDGTEIDTD